MDKFLIKDAERTSNIASIHSCPPTKKRKRNKVSADDNFYCTPSLLKWYKDGIIHQVIDSMNTKECQIHCRSNNLKVSGAKYVIRDRLIEHARLAKFREENNITTNDENNLNTNKDNVDKDDFIISKIERELASNTLSFAKSVKIFQKHIKNAKKLNVEKDGKNCYEMRLKMTLAAARGMDYQVYRAITGPKRFFYNGKHDDKGIEALGEVSNECDKLYEECKDLLTEESLNEFIAFISDEGCSLCEPYGMSYYVEGLAEDHIESLKKRKPMPLNKEEEI